MKTTSLPVSRKFYSDIVSRVNSSLSPFPASVSEAMRIINLYLDGKEISSTDCMAMLAFNMVKDEIDRAIARSRRARQRAAERKATSDKNEVKVADTASSAESLPTPEAEERKLSRRQRRAAARLLAGHKRRKWAPIGQSKRSSVHVGPVGEKF